MTATIRPPACTAQYTDTTNTWGCSGRHIDGWHTVTDTGGHVQHLWLDPQQPDRYDELLDVLLVRLSSLHARLINRTINDAGVRDVIDAYDALIHARTGVAV